MADSKLVFPPGWRATVNTNGNVAPGAKIYFYVGTTTPDAAYSDASLSTVLPNPITCDSGGYPASDAGDKVLVWRGTATYRVKITQSDGTVIDDKNGIPGALPFTSVQAQVSSREVGEVIKYLGSTPPSTRWLALNGKSIGSASSNSTARASDSADTLALYTLLWNTDTSNKLVIQTSAGVTSSKGASAGADFLANKRLALPHVAGRSMVGADNMGGIVSVNLLTGQSGGVDGDVPFNTGGAETHTLTEAQLPVIDPDSKMTDNEHVHGGIRRYGSLGAGSGSGSNWWNGTNDVNTNSAPTGITFSNIGSGSAHNNVQPTIVVPMVMVYAGVP